MLEWVFTLTWLVFMFFSCLPHLPFDLTFSPDIKAELHVRVCVNRAAQTAPLSRKTPAEDLRTVRKAMCVIMTDKDETRVNKPIESDGNVSSSQRDPS